MTRMDEDRTDAGNPRTAAIILASFIELIEELGSDDVSYKVIARRSGLGERTIARYFPTRFDLVAALGRHLDDEVFAPRPFASLFELPIVVRESMLRYSERHELAHLAAEASTRSSHGGPSPRADRIAAALDAEELDLDPTTRVRIIARLTHLDSAAGWATLVRWLGRDEVAVADAASWAVESSLDAVRDRALERAQFRNIGTIQEDSARHAGRSS